MITKSKISRDCEFCTHSSICMYKAAMFNLEMKIEGMGLDDLQDIVCVDISCRYSNKAVNIPGVRENGGK